LSGSFFADICSAFFDAETYCHFFQHQPFKEKYLPINVYRIGMQDALK